MIYIVTGMGRSGTSMMMACMEAGGLSVYSDETREKQLREGHPDTNLNGYHECHPDEINSWRFPTMAPDGSVVKMLSPWRMMGLIEPNHYRVVIMMRDPREILHSLGTFYNGTITDKDIKTCNEYYPRMVRGIQLAKNRKDMESVDVVQYREMVQDPEKVLKSLDWPIDVAKAASIVSPEAAKSPTWDFPFSGDVRVDMGLPAPISLEEAVLAGTLEAPPEVVEAVRNGARVQVTEG